MFLREELHLPLNMFFFTMHFRSFSARQQIILLTIMISICYCLTCILGCSDYYYIGSTSRQESDNKLGWSNSINNQVMTWLRCYLSSLLKCLGNQFRKRRKRSERKILNSNQRRVNGNRRNQMMKIVSWNSGSSQLKIKWKRFYWFFRKQYRMFSLFLRVISGIPMTEMKLRLKVTNY